MKHKRCCTLIDGRSVFNRVFTFTVVAILVFCVFPGMAATIESAHESALEESSVLEGVDSSPGEAENAGIVAPDETEGAGAVDPDGLEDTGAVAQGGIEDAGTEGAGAQGPDEGQGQDPGLAPADDNISFMPMGTGDLWDLRNFAPVIVIKDEEGYPLPPGENYVYNTAYTFELSFDAPQIVDGVMSYPVYSDGWLTYPLPAGVDILNSASGPIYLNGNTSMKIGDYIIENDVGSGGLVRIKFDDIKVGYEDGEAVSIEPDDANLLDNVVGNLEFGLWFNAKFVSSGDYTFDNDITITVTEDGGGDDPGTDPGSGQDGAGLKVWKTGSVYNAVSRTKDFKITLTAEGGDMKVTRIEDAITGSGASLESIFAGKNINDYVSNLEVSLNGTTIPADAVWTSDNKGFDIVFSGGEVTIPEGEAMTIVYTFAFDDIIRAKAASSLNYSILVGNKAEVFGKDDEGAEEPKGEDSYSTWISSSFSAKTGKYDVGTDTITWTASAGDYSTKLNGWTVADIFGTAGMDPEGVLNIIFRDQNGNEIYNETNPAYLDLDFESDGFTFTIPEGGVGYPAQDVYRVELSYTVDVTSSSPFNVTMSNTLSIDDGNGLSDTVTSPGVTVPRGAARVEKTGELFLGDQDNDNYIQWKVEFLIPGALQGIPVWFEDQLRLYTDDYSATPQEMPPFDMMDFSIECSDPGFNPAFDVFDDDGFVVRADPGARNMSLVNRPAGGRQLWTLLFNPGPGMDITDENYESGESGYPRSLSLSPFQKDTTITVTYKTPLNLPATGYPGTLLDFIKANERELSLVHNIGNEAFIFFVTPSSSLWWPDRQQDEARLRYPIHKWATVVGARIDYTVLLQVKTLNELEDFMDIFDADLLEYVPYSFRASMDEGSFYGPYVYGNPEIDKIAGNPATAGGEISYNFFELLQYNSGSTSMLVFGDDGYVSPPESINDPGIPPPRLSDSDDKYWVVRYSLKLKDGVELQEYTDVKNTAWLEHHDSECAVDVGEEAVKKTMLVTGSTATVEIVINPLGQAINWPEPPPGIYLAEDEMSENLVFIPGTLMFWTRDRNYEDSEWTMVTPAPAPESPSPPAAWTYRVNSLQGLDFWFPDETPVRVSYRVMGLKTGGDTYTNDISVLTYSDTFVLDGFEVSENFGTGDLNMTDLLVVKEDSVTGALIDGVEFGLYVSMNYSKYDDNKVLATAHGYPQGFELGGRFFYYIEDGVTENGFLNFYKELYYQDKFKSSNIIYALYEKEAPPGYLGPSGCDISSHSDLEDHLLLFYLHDPSDSVKEDFDGIELFDSFGMVEVLNEPDGTGPSEPEPTSVTISGDKELAGAGAGEAVPDAGFTFHAVQVDEPGDDSYTGEGLPLSGSGGLPGEGSFTIGISFDKVGEYCFKVYEGQSGHGIDGWNYSQAVYWVEVVVTDDGDGTLSADITGITVRSGDGDGGDGDGGDGGGDGEDLDPADTIVFENSFDNGDREPTSVTIAGEKELAGTGADEAVPDAGFTFHAVQVDEPGADSYTGEGTPLSGSGAKPGEGSFTINISFDKVGEYCFKVYENQSGNGTGGWSYSQAVYWVEVAVTDNGDGTLSADITGITVRSDDDGDGGDGDGGDGEGLDPAGAIVFENSFDNGDREPTSVTITGDKELIGTGAGDAVPDAGFTFHAVQVDGLGDDSYTGEGAPLSGNDGLHGDGSFAIGISFDKDGLYYFMVYEDQAGHGVGDWSYSQAVYWVEVTVTDNGDGTLTAEITDITDGSDGGSGDGGDDPLVNIVFENTFGDDPGDDPGDNPGDKDFEPASVTIAGNKEFLGAGAGDDVPDGGFTFNAVQVDGLGADSYNGNGAPLSGSGNLKGQGGFTIGISFDKTGLYYFKVSEGQGGHGVGGWSYSQAVYWVEVTVTENSDGALSAKITIITNRNDGGNGDDGPVIGIDFENSYGDPGAEEIGSDELGDDEPGGGKNKKRPGTTDPGADDPGTGTGDQGAGEIITGADSPIADRALPMPISSGLFKTGDNSNTLLWVMLGAVSFSAICLLAGLSFKRRKRKQRG